MSGLIVGKQGQQSRGKRVFAVSHKTQKAQVRRLSEIVTIYQKHILGSALGSHNTATFHSDSLRQFLTLPFTEGKKRSLRQSCKVTQLAHISSGIQTLKSTL